MRIAILGDFHLNPEDYDLTRSAMEDIAGCAPDLIIPLGDFGSHGKIGSIAGLEESFDFLKHAGAPLRPILGNHDLERESGSGQQTKGTMLKRFLQMFDLESPYGVLDYEDYRLFFSSAENQSPESCYNVQEVFATDEQFHWIKKKLKERPGVPVVFFTHAPPIGAGLRTVPRVHVRSTNAYLDENHNPYRWYHLFKNTPEIVMWFSAHYHLSHNHPDSNTIRFGTHFFMTGVHGAAFTRDGNRQSRILDIEMDCVKVRTLDHIKRAETEEGSWRHGGPLRTLMQKTEIFPVCIQSVSVGEAPAIKAGIVPLSLERCLVSTEDGFSWEAEPQVEAVFGTCHIGPSLTAVTASGQHIWMAWGNEVGRTDRRSPWRFVRDAKGAWPSEKLHLKCEVTAMCAHPDGGVWVAEGLNLWKIGTSSEHGRMWAQTVTSLPEPIRALVSDGSSLWCHGESGTVYCLNTQNGIFEPIKKKAAAWDTWRGYSASISVEKDQLILSSEDGLNQFMLSIPAKPEEVQEDHPQIVCLGAHRVLAITGGETFIALVNEQTMKKLDTRNGVVTSIARSFSIDEAEPCSSFYLSLRPENEGSQPAEASIVEDMIMERLMGKWRHYKSEEEYEYSSYRYVWSW